jgi:hypothetical protein
VRSNSLHQQPRCEPIHRELNGYRNDLYFRDFDSSIYGDSELREFPRS